LALVVLFFAMQPIAHGDQQHRRKRQRRAAPTIAPGMNMMNPLAQMINPMMNPMMAMMMNQQPAHQMEEESQSEDDQPLQQVVAKAQESPSG
jgi:Mg2+/Co2+ transporter CorB